MEHLTRQQIILLALFVSFFSSIATGIVVFSLMDQSLGAGPVTATQTVNRVIERTIEKAAPASNSPIKETVIVKDDQATVDAIARASRSIARIGVVSPGSSSEGYVSIGTIVTASGKIVARLDTPPSPGQSFYAHLNGGGRVSVSFIGTDASTGLSVFQADQSTDPKAARAYTPAVLGDAGGIKLGQTVIFVWGYEIPSVATGIVSTIEPSSASIPQAAGPRRIMARANGIAGFDSHLVLVNLLGEVVGLKDSTDISGGPSLGASFIPSNLIKPYATASTLHN